MALYMISFDLNGHDDRAYQELSETIHNEINDLGPWLHPVSTTYLLSSKYQLADIEAILIRHLTKKDRMLICQTSHPIAGFLDNEDRAWIRTTL